MGMSLGSSDDSGEPELMIDVNTTPLIDVMLVLIIHCPATAAFFAATEQ